MSVLTVIYFIHIGINESNFVCVCVCVCVFYLLCIVEHVNE